MSSEPWERKKTQKIGKMKCEQLNVPPETTSASPSHQRCQQAGQNHNTQHLTKFQRSISAFSVNRFKSCQFFRHASLCQITIFSRTIPNRGLLQATSGFGISGFVHAIRKRTLRRFLQGKDTTGPVVSSHWYPKTYAQHASIAPLHRLCAR